MIREPAVAGSFYSANGSELRRQVDELFSATMESTPAFGLMAPHAGYVYSGSIAAQTYAEVDIPRTVVLLGPDHVGLASTASVYSKGRWRTPLGDVPIDENLAAAILHKSPLFTADSVAHGREHSLEVHLPLLQVRQPNLSIVPILFGRGELGDWTACGQALQQCLAQWPEPVLLVASSDMSHFLTAEQAQQVDQQALEPLLQLKPKELYQTVIQNQISMCGVIPATVLVSAAVHQGGCNARLVRYGHSGEVSGDHQRVVGYAGVVIA